MSSRREGLRVRSSIVPKETKIKSSNLPTTKEQGNGRESLHNRPVPVFCDDKNVKVKINSLQTSVDANSVERNSGDENELEDAVPDELEHGDVSDEEPVIKARVLTNDDDNTGHSIYGFKTPKRKEALAKLANSVKRPTKSPCCKSKTPANKDSKQIGELKPSKKNTIHIQAVNMNDNKADDTSGGESSDDEGSDSDNSSNNNNNEEKNGNCDLLDEYFQVHHKSHKSITSDKTLAQLSNPKMQRKELTQHLKDVQSSHIKETVRLHSEMTLLFDKWMFQLLCGFNVLLYGFGSKRNLLDKFRTRCLQKSCHLVVNGYFPNITIKQILNLITEDLLEKDIAFKNVIDHCTYIKDLFDADTNSKLFLLVHNIDGQMLRSQNAQTALGHLASSKNIHVIASIDHINAPLVWDQNRASHFNWIWYDSTTFEPYSEETSYENSLLVQQSGTLALSSLTHVLRSLTPNARGIFKLLADCHLDNESNTGYQGLSFAELYSRCREEFLVNSDLTLRAQLTEFKDHKLIKSKKGFDGIEYLSLALDLGTIKQFLENEGT